MGSSIQARPLGSHDPGKESNQTPQNRLLWNTPILCSMQVSELEADSRGEGNKATHNGGRGAIQIIVCKVFMIIFEKGCSC